MSYVRRADGVVVSWDDSALVIRNFLSRQVSPATPEIVALLDACSEWRTRNAVEASIDPLLSPPERRSLVSLLLESTFLESAKRPRVARPLDSWRPWSPEAAFFHFSTRDGIYRSQAEMHGALVEKARFQPPPAPTKRYRGAKRVTLPAAQDLGNLGEALRRRRTWRAFAPAAVDLSSVATLLGWTWGVQAWAHTELGACALKTSPSGGARHCTEVYLFARRVKGLAAGCYHYDPDGHALTLVKAGLHRTDLERDLAGQDCYADVPAVFVMTAVFARMQWRYGFSRAYRVVLLDAGHLGQTFCLVATALGLAPFSTAALADSRIERRLGLDGIKESVLYACGVGAVPTGPPWRPWADTDASPPLTPSAFARRLPRVQSLPTRGRKKHIAKD